MENYIVAFVAFFFGLIIKGIAGFGEPLFISPVLAFMYSNQVITPNLLVISLPINFYFFVKNIKEVKIRQILPVLIFVMIGALIGIALLSYAQSSIIKIVLGAIIILIGLEMLLRKQNVQSAKPSFAAMGITSLFSGITAGLYNINMFILAYFERTSTSRNDFRANICFIFFAESILRLIVYISIGFFTKETISLLFISLPASCLGFFVGQLFDKKLDDKKVRFITILIFIISGLSIVIKEITGF
ncbi:MAG: sulfite exporter TauE/SafE family protein [Treponemataceae bacterium]